MKVFVALFLFLLYMGSLTCETMKFYKNLSANAIEVEGEKENKDLKEAKEKIVPYHKNYWLCSIGLGKISDKLYGLFANGMISSGYGLAIYMPPKVLKTHSVTV